MSAAMVSASRFPAVLDTCSVGLRLKSKAPNWRIIVAGSDPSLSSSSSSQRCLPSAECTASGCASQMLQKHSDYHRILGMLPSELEERVAQIAGRRGRLREKVSERSREEP